MKIRLMAIALTLFAAGCASPGGNRQSPCAADSRDACAAQTRDFDGEPRRRGHVGSYQDRTRRQGRQQCDYVVGHNAWICY